jgi:hypothetical protein
MAQVASHQPLTAEAQIHTWSVHVGIVMHKVPRGQVFL